MVGILTGQPMSTCEQPRLVLSLTLHPAQQNLVTRKQTKI